MRVKLAAGLAAAAGIAAAVVAGVVLAGSSDPAASPAPPPAPPAPAEGPVISGPRVPSLAGPDPVTGEQVRLADYEGKRVVINVWASWCAPCRDEAPALAAFAESHPDAVLLGVNMQDTARAARAFYRRYGWTHPSIADPDGAIAARLGLLGLPTTIFLTKGHRESSRIVGPVTTESLEAGFAAAG